MLFIMVFVVNLKKLGGEAAVVCKVVPPHPSSILHFMRADRSDDAAAQRSSIITWSKIRPELQKMSFSHHSATISTLHAAPLCLLGDSYIIRAG